MAAMQPETRIELVDDAHPAWPAVLNFIDGLGQRHQVRLMDSRWLATRQNILAAFDGEQVVGHLGFHLEPSSDHRITAQLDFCAVAEGYDDQTIGQRLHEAAVARAREIHADPARIFCPPGESPSFQQDAKPRA